MQYSFFKRKVEAYKFSFKCLLRVSIETIICFNVILHITNSDLFNIVYFFVQKQFKLNLLSLKDQQLEFSAMRGLYSEVLRMI